MTTPELPRTDPAVVQQWRDRQIKRIPPPATQADKLLAQQKLADLLDNPQRLTGKLSRMAQAGGKAMVVLDKPYRGLKTMPVIAIDGCDTPGKVTLLKDAAGLWYAIGKGVVKVRRDRHIERSGEDRSSSVLGEIAYCYSVFLQRRTATNQPYKWFWQVFIGGWIAENILIKEWEVPEDNVNLGKPRNLTAPQAIVDFREGTFYVSLRYTLWVSNAPQQRYALLKGTKQEDLETRWDKSTSEMLSAATLPSNTSTSLEPRGFGYWSSQTDQATNYSLYDGAITTHPYVAASTNDRTTLIPQGWGKTPKTVKYLVTDISNPQESSGQTIKLPVSIGVVTSSQYTNPPGINSAPDQYSEVVDSFTGASSDQEYTRTQDLFALYRISEDGENLLSGSKKIVYVNTYSSHSYGKYTYIPTATDLTGRTFTAGNVGGGGTYLGGTLYSYTSSYLQTGTYGGGTTETIKTKLQDSVTYSYEKTSSNITTFSQGTAGNSTNTVDSNPPEIVKIDMPESGGNLPFMAKLANIGSSLTTSPAKPAIATGSVIPGLTSLAPGLIAGAGSPYLTDVNDKFISAIQCSDLLNRGTVETQNIYGDLSPIYPLVADASALSALTGMSDGASYGVTALNKVYTFNIASTATPNGTTVLNAAGGFGRWLEKENLPTGFLTPDPAKLPGVMTIIDLFPEIQTPPLSSEWIGYRNIEHENRAVKVFLWNSELSGPYKVASVEVDVQKINAVAQIIADTTLRKLLSYTFFNASFG